MENAQRIISLVLKAAALGMAVVSIVPDVSSADNSKGA